MNTSRKIDMTKGPIMPSIMLFALPIIAGNILQYLYTTVDTLVIGNYCDHAAIAAVGTSAQPVEMFLCVFIGIGTGVSILVSQHVGAGDLPGIRNTCRTAVTFVYMCGIPVSIAGFFLAPLILRLMGVPADVWDNALLYTRIVLMSATANIGYNMNAGILRGIGDSRASLIFLAVACVINVVLDIVLVAVFGLGVPGVAVATGIAMVFSWLVSITYIKKRYPELLFTFLPRGIVRRELKKIIYLGLPIGINNSLFSLGHVALQTLINAQGSVFMAGWSVAGRVTGIANMAITGIAAAATTYSGQNYGAGRTDRLRAGQYRIPFSAGAITLAFGVFFMFLRMHILALFTRDEDVLLFAGKSVMIMLSCMWMYAILNTISCIINGTGKVRYTTVINLLMLWAVRIPSAILITRFLDSRDLLFCFPISFAFGLFCMLAYYFISPSWKALMAGTGN